MRWRPFWLAGGWLLVAIVVYLSLVPQPPEVLPFPASDKFKHVLAYATLSLWFCQIYLHARQRAGVVAALIALGVALEFVQRWSGYRMFELADMAADAVGALGGWLLVFTPLGRVLAACERLWR